jgi:hypothetical protein
MYVSLSDSGGNSPSQRDIEDVAMTYITQNDVVNIAKNAEKPVEQKLPELSILKRYE